MAPANEIAAPVLTFRREGGYDMPLLVWRLAEPVLAVSSASLGGGLGLREWIINATVPMSYAREDPATHLSELAGELSLDGPGVGLLTGVDVADLVTTVDSGVTVWATVGLSTPIWAAEAEPTGPADRVGTINVVAWLPARLTDAALVNAVATVAEAKAQALRELDLPATGTATDAVCLTCPATESLAGPDTAYGGPRSRWGARLARAVREAILGGSGSHPWSDKAGLPHS
jgi:adenosylcobinamide amidohydrolase